MKGFLSIIVVTLFASPVICHHLGKDKRSFGDVICPDGKSACPDKTTCCKISTESWGCCPYPNAVCCSDNIHCCPDKTRCDVTHGICLRLEPYWGITSLPWRKKLSAEKNKNTPGLPVRKALAVKVQQNQVTWFKKRLSKNVTEWQANDVRCDSFSSCPDGTTCCKLSSGGWGCCPMPKAVCCNDHLHCCPSGTTCDTAHGTCINQKSMSREVLVTTLRPTKTSYTMIVCPDQESYCPDGSTCCQLLSGHYGCCPMPMATCCHDDVHCCPHDSYCDLKRGLCRRGTSRTPLVAKTQPILLKNVDKSLLCDKETLCTEDSYCCITDQGAWSCCPQ